MGQMEAYLFGIPVETNNELLKRTVKVVCEGSEVVCDHRWRSIQDARYQLIRTGSEPLRIECRPAVLRLWRYWVKKEQEDIEQQIAQQG